MMIYVDNLMNCIKNNNWRYSQSCHMIADNTEELLRFAKSIGLKPQWIQFKGTYKEHFDLNTSKREKAIAAGAQSITTIDFIKIIKERRELSLSTP